MSYPDPLLSNKDFVPLNHLCNFPSDKIRYFLSLILNWQSHIDLLKFVFDKMAI